MTSDKIKEVIGLYQKTLERLKVPKTRAPLETIAPEDTMGRLAHCHQMLDKMQEFLDQGRVDKAFRWLGFVQGVLWSNYIFTIEEMANHNRP